MNSGSEVGAWGCMWESSPQIKFSHLGPDGKIYGDFICLMLVRIVCFMLVCNFVGIGRASKCDRKTVKKE